MKLRQLSRTWLDEHSSHSFIGFPRVRADSKACNRHTHTLIITESDSQNVILSNSVEIHMATGIYVKRYY